MKKIIILSLLLIVTGGAALTVSAGSPARADAAFDVFWQKFKTAVSKKDAQSVAALSKFPIEMSYGIASIKSKSALQRRYREVFNEQTDAAKCFANAKPERDAEDAKRFTVACPDAAGNEVVVYHFERTKPGWKFTALDNINE